jgi:hypothetical protein
VHGEELCGSFWTIRSHESQGTKVVGDRRSSIEELGQELDLRGNQLAPHLHVDFPSPKDEWPRQVIPPLTGQSEAAEGKGIVLSIEEQTENFAPNLWWDEIDAADWC